MGFTEAVKISFRKYFDFSTRSLRSEYWFFTLFIQIIYLLAIIYSFFIEYLIDGEIFHSEVISDLLMLSTIIIFFIVSLGTTIPFIALCTRRLHDINRSGWWQLIALSIVGIFPLIYWISFKKGDENENEYGPHPLK